MRNIHYLILLFASGLLALFSCAAPIEESLLHDPSDRKWQNYWTIMIYADGDNNLERYLIDDINEMKRGYIDYQGYKVIVLADRVYGESRDSSAFGEDFTDTRLYKINSGRVTRLNGGAEFPEISTSSNYEANMGDASTLKKFIRFCKVNYPAQKYALILWNHGGGTRGEESSPPEMTNKAVCWDDTNGKDALYIGEISSVLTSAESVDLLGFDACLMGSVEVAYQFRPGNGGFNAQVMVASPSNVWAYGWKYDNIFQRLRSGGGESGESDTIVGAKLGFSSEKYYDPLTMSAVDLAGVIIEEQFDSVGTLSSQSLSCYNLNKVSDVKYAVDELAKTITTETKWNTLEELRGIKGVTDNNVMHFFNIEDTAEWLEYPFFDLYDLGKAVAGSSLDTVKGNAIKTAVENFIIYSFGGTQFISFNGNSFERGKNGVHIFFPDGDDHTYSGKRQWASQWWYNPIDTGQELTPYGQCLYGKLQFCGSGTQANGIVENWFEMLDKYCDDHVSSGYGAVGYNGYQY